MKLWEYFDVNMDSQTKATVILGNSAHHIGVVETIESIGRGEKDLDELMEDAIFSLNGRCNKFNPKVYVKDRFLKKEVTRITIAGDYVFIWIDMEPEEVHSTIHP